MQSVFANQGVSFEVIAIDDCSKDRSVEIAREFPCRVIALQNNIMSANCRNLASRLCPGRNTLFFSILMRSCRRIHSNVFAEVFEQHPDVVAGVGSFEADTPMDGFFSKFKNLRHHYTHQSGNPEGSTLDSGKTAIRKAIFDQYGGFEPSFQPASIEDIALGYKLARNNHRILFCNDIQVSHLKAFTLKELVLSDILDRAVPWTGLMIRDRMWRNNLNTSSGNMLSVFCSWLIPLAVLMAAFVNFCLGGGVVIGALLFIWFSNRGLLGVANRNFGFIFWVKSLFFIPFMYFYQGIGLVLGIFIYLTWGGPVKHNKRPPDPEYTIFESDLSSNSIVEVI